MKKLLLYVLILAAQATAADSGEFRIGRPVSNFSVRGTDGHTVSYSDFPGTVTVVMFFSTRCPISNAFNYRRNELYKDFHQRVRFIVADPNSNESMEEVRNYARAVEFDFPVYEDLDNAAADQLHAQLTTDAFLIDATGILRYHGYVEDSPNPTRASIRGLRLAIEAVLAGKPVAAPETKARGCSIRRVRP